MYLHFYDISPQQVNMDCVFLILPVNSDWCRPIASLTAGKQHKNIEWIYIIVVVCSQRFRVYILESIITISKSVITMIAITRARVNKPDCYQCVNGMSIMSCKCKQP